MLALTKTVVIGGLRTSLRLQITLRASTYLCVGLLKLTIAYTTGTVGSVACTWSTNYSIGGQY